MKKKRVNTKLGEACFYVMDDVYPDRITVFVKYEKTDQENEFSVSPDLAESGIRDLVILHAHSFSQGRYYGLWEKGKQLRELIRGITTLAS